MFGFYTGILGKSIFNYQIKEEKTREIIIEKNLENIDLNLETKEFKLSMGEEITKEETRELTQSEEAARIVAMRRADTSKEEKIISEEKSRLEKIKAEILSKKSAEYSEEGFMVKEAQDVLKKRMLALQSISPTMPYEEKTEEIKKEIIEQQFGVIEDPIDNEAIEAIVEQIGDKTVEVPNIDQYSDELFGKVDAFIEEENEEVESTKETVIENISNHNESDLAIEPTSEEVIREATKETVIEVDETTEEQLAIVKEETVEEIIEETVEEVIECVDYELPSLTLLTADEQVQNLDAMKAESVKKSEIIDTLFKNFKIGAKVIDFKIGPTVTTYEITVEPGTKLTKITNLEDDMKMALSAKSIRIQAPIPGKSLVGVEVPNDIKKLVTFKEAFKQTINESAEDKILISMGQDVFGDPISFDLAATPHMLIAGSTGSGKSVAVNTILASILLRYKPQDLKLVLVDPKMVEFAPFHNIPHLITPVITNANDANLALKSVVAEMEDRYKTMAKTGSRNLIELNKKLVAEGKEKIPFLVAIVDELADLMMVAAKEVEDSIMRITQKARAAGIHMIVATQRPSTDVITGVIKSNIPSRIAFTVASSIDSRTILDKTGAEKLVGKGDMLMSLYGQIPVRGQGCYISSEEIDAITTKSKEQCSPNYQIDIKEQKETVDFTGGISIDDPLYQAALEIVILQGKASTSLLQRHLRVGYNKAANLIDALEASNKIGPANGSKPREVLVSND